MPSVATICRKLRGATLLFVLWLSLVPAVNGMITPVAEQFEARSAAALTHLVADPEIVLAKERSGVVEQLDQGSDGSDAPPAPSQFQVLSAVLAHSQLHRLPKSTGPPPSPTHRHYQARAPPFA